MSSSSSTAGKLKKLKSNADGEIDSSKSIKHNKMNADGGGGGTGSSSVGGGTGTRPQQQQLATNDDSRTVQPTLHLSSDEVNYLVFRSVQELFCRCILYALSRDPLLLFGLFMCSAFLIHRCFDNTLTFIPNNFFVS